MSQGVPNSYQPKSEQSDPVPMNYSPVDELLELSNSFSLPFDQEQYDIYAAATLAMSWQSQPPHQMGYVDAPLSSPTDNGQYLTGVDDYMYSPHDLSAQGLIPDTMQLPKEQGDFQVLPEVPQDSLSSSGNHIPVESYDQYPPNVNIPVRVSGVPSPSTTDSSPGSPAGPSWPMTIKLEEQEKDLIQLVVGSERIHHAAGQRRKKTEGLHRCPYPKTGCKATFTAPHNLRYHINSHLGLKPYKCSFCSYAAASPATTKRHQTTCKDAAAMAGNALGRALKHRT